MTSTPERVKVFLDTSALFSAIWSESGGARMILKLGEAEAARIVIGSQVLAEIDTVLRVKYPQGLPGLARLLDRCCVEVIDRVDPETLAHCQELTSHPGDGRVLAEAWCAGVDFLVTHDKIHPAENSRVAAGAPFPVGSPGDFLAWYRSRFLSEGEST